MTRFHTDLEILEAIQERQREEMSRADAGQEGASENYVPVDLEAVADQLGVDADRIYTRLYYHLDFRYGYRRDDGRKVSFFAPLTSAGENCVNFPYLESVLGRLQREEKKSRLTVGIALAAVVIAMISVMILVLT